jgi:hypothetical protein
MRSFVKVWLWALALLTAAIVLTVAGQAGDRSSARSLRTGRPPVPGTDRAISLVQQKIARRSPLTAEEKRLFSDWTARHQHRGRTHALDNTGGPDGFGYAFMDNVAPDTATYDWIELCDDPDALDGPEGDDVTALVNMGLTFPFYGSNYTSCYISTNGAISFGGEVGGIGEFSALDPATTEPAFPYIAPLWTDQFAVNVGGGCNDDGAPPWIRYRSFGTHIVVEWADIPQYMYNDQLFKYEAILYSNGRIKLQYHTGFSIANPVADGNSGVGIDAPGANNGTRYWFYANPNGPSQGFQPDGERAVWFVLPDGIPNAVTNLHGTATGSTVTLTWTDPDHDTNGNPLTPDSLLIYRGDLGNEQQIGHVGPGAQTFDATEQPNGELTYQVRAKSGTWRSSPVSIIVVVGNPSYTSDFEGDDGTLVPEPATGGWTWGAPTNIEGPGQAHSGNNVWAVGLNAEYSLVECDDLDVNLGMNVISPDASIEFWCWYAVEETYDGVDFRASVDGGDTWEVLQPSEHPYDYVMPTLWESCIGGDSAWSGFTNMWVHVTIPIGQFAGQTPIFRIKFASDNIVTDPGFFLDDLTIWGLAPREDGFPRPVTNFQGTSNGTRNVTLTWLDPTQDTNGNTLIPDSIKIYRDGSDSAHQIGHVGPGIQTITLLNQPEGDAIYYARAKANGWISQATATSVLVGTPTYSNDFEMDDGTLMPDPAAGGWEWGVPTNPGGPTQAHSGNNVWAVGLSTNYQLVECDDLDVNLGLAVVSPNANIQFWCWYSVEQTYDGVTLRASLDDGATWQVLQPSQHRYESVMPTEWENCIGGDSAWTGFANTWVQVTVPIGQFAGQTPIFRFKFGSDNIITDPGFFMDDLVIWGLQPPQGAPVSGTVALSGGHGNVAQASIAANGLGTPVTQPAADGTYTLSSVQVGSRRLLASLGGYLTDTLRITLDSAGYTDADFVLRRVPPPAPTGLTSVVQTAARKDSLHWAVSPDTTVDCYKVYRKLTTQQTYSYRLTVFGRTTQWVKDTLENYGLYNWVVTAVDTNMQIPPWSESANSNIVADPFGHQPPINLTADGGFDNHIHLIWNDPTTQAQLFLSYDDGRNDADGIGWWHGRPESGWILAHYQGEGPLTVRSVRAYLTDRAAIGAPVQVGVFADDGTGRPAAHPLAVMDATVNSPLNSQQEWLFDRPVAVPSGSFYVGIRQMTPNTVGLGGDLSTPFITHTFYYDFDGNGWNSFEPQLPIIPMLSARVSDGVTQGAELARSTGPVAVRKSSSGADFLTRSSRVAKTLSSPAIAKGTAPSGKTGAMAEGTRAINSATPMSPHPQASLTPDLPHLAAVQMANSVGPHSPNALVTSMASHGRNGGALDEVRRYLVYMDNVLVDSTAPSLTDYSVMNLPENVAHNFQIKARYDDDTLSVGSNTVNARCNMAPGMPGNVVSTPIGQTQMRITWSDPMVNADGSPCTDLAGLRVYRDDQLITTTPVAPGVHQYTDFPPDPMVVYTWTVKAIDEVPNESDGASVSGSVVSPWHTVDYEWIDISGQGNQIANCFGCYAGPYNIGFPFTFYGNTYTQVGVSSNGFIEFTGTDIWTWDCPPTTWTPNNAVYLMATELNPSPSGGGQVRFYSDVANQRCVISWIGVPYYPNVGSYTMQVVLDHNNGVTLSYQNISGTQGVVGVENADGSDGVSLWCNQNGDWQPQNNSSVQFWGGPRQAIAGWVRHSGGTNPPLPGVWVSDGIDSLQTDPAGFYQLRVEPGTYTVRFHHATHCDSTRTVVVNAGVSDTLNLSLRSAAVAHDLSSLTFLVHRNQMLDQTFTLSDTGACPLHYQMVDSVAWLSSTPQSGDLDPGESQLITVRASPGLMQPGEYQTTLWIVANAQGTPFALHVDLQVLSVGEVPGALPTEFALHPNYPNPFNPTTVLPFDVPQQSQVDLVVYNVMGQEVARLVSGVYAAGRYQAAFTGENLPSGLYFVKMKAGSFTSIDKIMLLK